MMGHGNNVDDLYDPIFGPLKNEREREREYDRKHGNLRNSGHFLTDIELKYFSMFANITFFKKS